MAKKRVTVSVGTEMVGEGLEVDPLRTTIQGSTTGRDLTLEVSMSPESRKMAGILLWRLATHTRECSCKQFVRAAIPAAAILVPFAFFFSVLTPDATRQTR